MRYLRIVLLILLPALLRAQGDTSQTEEYYTMDYQRPQKVVVGGIGIIGVQFLDERILSVLTGLYEGQTISLPGDELTKAIENLWKQKFFVNIQVRLKKMEGNKVFIDFYLEERPRLSEIKIRRLKKTPCKKSARRLKHTKRSNCYRKRNTTYPQRSIKTFQRKRIF
ncbi:hypothetical protein QQ054_35655 [Oscillatoria amoena NRMC-F 0135]|nr:hypothetical protein [Oscillatoria amoena NRMC-F 0135]